MQFELTNKQTNEIDQLQSNNILLKKINPECEKMSIGETKDCSLKHGDYKDNYTVKRVK